MRPWFLLLDAGTHAAFAGEASEVQMERVAVALPAMRTNVTGFRAPKTDRGDDSAGGEAAVCCRRGMDQEAAGWADPRGAGGRNDFEVRECVGRVAGQQQISRGPGRRGELCAPISDTSESSGTNRVDTETRERAGDLLPRRGASRGGLAVCWRAESDVARSELRMGARQGGCCVRGGCVCGDRARKRDACGCSPQLSGSSLYCRGLRTHGPRN